ncbi:alpha/beta fold hydrolase [Candidatus Viridilinea mediisalina]|uniref:Alpha/beta hydrolase n=1 Tax=Candidatus Viridilinea mediisalina TaxID=2024553 RepID=A0A2A6RNY4_9CHLR|nr:alpha/beta hydrolase [Candidatus Viridilinea mediisalina]PDW04588.1 alpha/beta hydrolase [Candidatus Viridilinea mediisalina]
MSFSEPLSRVLIPLVLGITRRFMLRGGTQSCERRLAGIPTHYYQLPARGNPQNPMPVVLIHGIADSAITWAFVARGMAKIGPVYAVDLPGFGLSGYPAGRRYASINEQVQVIEALLRDVVGGPALLVGNSMGGWIAARLAVRNPELARGIVLLDPGGAQLAGRPSWEPFADTVAVRDMRTVRRIYRQMFGRVPLALYLAQHSFRDLFLRDAVREFVAAAKEDDFFSPEELAAIRVPVALVWGSRDTFLPAGSFEFFRDNLTSAEVCLLPGCGHLPQRERPYKLVRFTRRFAARLGSAGDA